MSKASHLWPNHGFITYKKNIRTPLTEESKKKEKKTTQTWLVRDRKKKDDEWEE